MATQVCAVSGFKDTLLRCFKELEVLYVRLNQPQAAVVKAVAWRMKLGLLRVDEAIKQP
jgi:hypothetical protein